MDGQTLINGSFWAGAALGLILGAILGFMIARHLNGTREGEKRLTQLQLASMFMLFVYVPFAYAVGDAPSEFIVGAIMATFGGEAVGKAIQKGLDKK